MAQNYAQAAKKRQENLFGLVWLLSRYYHIILMIFRSLDRLSKKAKLLNFEGLLYSF